MMSARRKREIDDARPHGGELAPTRAIDLLTETVAHAICKSVYGGACVCERRRVSICATIEGAATAAIATVRAAAAPS